MIKSNLLEDIERQELVQKLVSRGQGELVEALLANEKQVYTKKGRLNKSGLCRVLGWKSKQVEDALEECRKILKSDVEED
jgi:hypothetical protein